MSSGKAPMAGEDSIRTLQVMVVEDDLVFRHCLEALAREYPNRREG